MTNMRKLVVFEMETSDPDDFMTLLWLADHPDVDLLAVLVTPGGLDQCRIVRWALDRCGKNYVRIGTLHGPEWTKKPDGKDRVSAFHYKVYGEELRTHLLDDSIVEGPALLANIVDRFRGNVTVVVGSAPKNIGAAFARYPEIKLARWVQQGGFAGDNIVAPEHRLAKFKSRTTCPSFNPGGAPKETLALLADPRISERIFVSKNVCHGVIWTRDLHVQLLNEFGCDSREELEGMTRVGLQTMVHGLDCYLRDKGVGKAMHDLVAAAVALDESVCELKPVEVYRERGEWGARESATPNARISVAFDMDRFVEVLAQ